MSRPVTTAATVRAHRRPVRRSRLAVIGATLTGALAVGMLSTVALTSATFTDATGLTVGTSGIGSSDPFAVILVDPAGTAHTAAPGTPLPLDVRGADTLVPGRTVETTVLVANNHADIAATLTATVGATREAGTPDITPHLRVTILAADGQVLLGGAADRPQDGAVVGMPGILGRLAARATSPVADRTPWAAGAEGSGLAITVRVHLLDDPATATLNGGRARLTVRFDATATETTP